MFFAEFSNQGGCDALCAAAVRQHFAQHGAKTHNQGEAAKGSADAGFNRTDDFIQWHPLHQSDSKRHQDESDEAVHFETDHQEE